MIGALSALLPLASGEAVEEGKKIIFWMLGVGLLFISVIALGELSRWRSHRRRAGRRAH